MLASRRSPSVGGYAQHRVYPYPRTGRKEHFQIAPLLIITIIIVVIPTVLNTHVKILYVSQYFSPEMGAPAARAAELSRHWVRMRHEVTVLTGFPNHPTGIIPRSGGRGCIGFTTWKLSMESDRSYLAMAASKPKSSRKNSELHVLLRFSGA